ncbi:putative ribosomal protein S18, partial [Trichinella spiralis]|uniref:putative ribosomal protein S18 n=1 Tax=Trichinella spiralis TaxID=6334 RepID=UPI0001EFE499
MALTPAHFPHQPKSSVIFLDRSNSADRGNTAATPGYARCPISRNSFEGLLETAGNESNVGLLLSSQGKNGKRVTPSNPRVGRRGVGLLTTILHDARWPLGRIVSYSLATK